MNLIIRAFFPSGTRWLTVGLLAVTVSCGNKTGNDVDAGPVESVTVLPAQSTVTIGFTRTLSADVRDSAGVVIPDAEVMWSIDPSNVASVSDEGLVTGVAPGSATVTATVDGISGTATITVIVQQTAEGDTIALSIRRLSGSSGPVVVSNGIPLPMGHLRPDQMDNVSVVMGGQEQSIFVEPLVSRHEDGTVRSILVQFNATVNAGSPVDGFLLVGTDVTRNAPDISKTSITWDTPAAVALPTSAAYLASTLIVGPSITADELPAGLFRTWQNDFEDVGEDRWANDGLNEMSNHQYDRALVWYAGWVRTGDPKYWDRGTATANAVVALHQSAGYQYQPHFDDLQGSELHYLLVGAEQGRETIRGVAEFMDVANYRAALDRDPFEDWMDSRIQSYVLMSSLFAARLDVGGRDWAAQARDDLDDIISTQSADGSMRWFSWDDGHSVFMASLLVHAMIRYYTWFEADPRIPSFVKGVLDFVHPDLWMGDSWQYVSNDPTPTVDLNQLNAIGYAWYGWLSGDATYTEVARTAFEFGADDAFLGFKQFNQNYRGAFQTAWYILNVP
jgi:hypothetical protein